MTDLFRNTRTEEQLRLIEAAKRFSSEGGKHRAKKLSPKQRTDIASKAANTRWKNLQEYA